MNESSTINRRDFLKITTGAGGMLIIGTFLATCEDSPSVTPTSEATATASPRPTLEPTATPSATPTPEPGVQFEPNLFVRIDTKGQVTITVPRIELGQGVRTALPMILAEELEAEWSTIRVETAPADPAFGRQRTTGSNSIGQTFIPLRRAGAIAREMLIAAAAQVWGVEQETCHAANGAVHHEASERRLTYGELVETAADLPVPGSGDVTLKDPNDFRLVGTRLGAIDAPQIGDGRAIFGLDVRVPDMLYAVVARCPVLGGTVASFDPAPAQAVDGVRHVVQIDDGIAVVAENTWAAIQGRAALDVTWDQGRNVDLSSTEIHQTLLQRLEEFARMAPPADAGEALEAIYETPFLAHATMEPMNCTADVQSDRCTVWAPTQAPQEAKGRAVELTGLPSEAVTVYVPLVGGGFGRRSYVDYVEQAVQISQMVGAPVQVVWTREDDIQHDLYHPLNLLHARARLDEPASLTITPYPAERGVPTGIWRTVDNFHQAFAHECFLDELAEATGQDPYEMRRELLPDRERVVLDLAAEKAGWGDPLPTGRGRGIAFHSTWDVTHVAQVAEVSMDPNGIVRVQRVVCAVDCGLAINPDMVEAQMEGGIVFGLSAALHGEITVEKGRVQQSNFHDYPILRFDEMPVIEVYIVPSQEPPQGVGEMGVAPIAPAVANALYALTGQRIRRLPIRLQGT